MGCISATEARISSRVPGMYQPLSDGLTPSPTNGWELIYYILFEAFAGWDAPQDFQKFLEGFYRYFEAFSILYISAFFMQSGGERFPGHRRLRDLALHGSDLYHRLLFRSAGVVMHIKSNLRLFAIDWEALLSCDSEELATFKHF